MKIYQELKKIETIFIGFIWFSLFFYVIALFFGGNQKFREIAPWYFLISRDVFFTALLLFFVHKVKTFYPKQLMGINYKNFLKVFTILISLYLCIVFMHLFHKQLKEVVQHDFRNMIFYSFFLPFLPALFQRKKSLDIMIMNILYVGLTLSIVGIITRYTIPSSLTWNGRIISTMGDPNNFAIFLSLCMFIVINLWKVIGQLKSLFFFTIYLFAFVLANSVTAFAVANFGLLFIFLLRNRIKGILYSILIIYAIITLSFLTKILENPNDNIKYLVTTSFNEDKYLIDKLNIVSKGKFCRMFMFGVNTYIDEKRRNLFGLQPLTNGTIRTYNNRVKQVRLFLMKDLQFHNIFFGNFNNEKYIRYDSQYLNLIANSGVIGWLIFLFLFSWSSFTGLKLWWNFKDTDILSFTVFIFSMLLLGFNGGAFLNRFPLNFLLYLSMGVIFLKKDMENRLNED